MIELKVPSAGESITEVTIAEWLKEEGAFAKSDEIVALIETDKANVELVAPADGRITRILKAAGESAAVGEVIAYMDASGEKTVVMRARREPAKQPEPKPEPAKASAPKPAAPAPKVEPKKTEPPKVEPKTSENGGRPMASPAVRRAMREHEIDPSAVKGTGPAGRILMNDLAKQSAETGGRAAERQRIMADGRETEVVPMTGLRKRIAERLVEAQQSAALLTTFNEIDMSAVMALRKQHQDAFVAKHGIKLGFMSFFVKAAIEALKEFPAINAEISGDQIVYHNYFDIGVAVGGGRGLVVPVIRSAERLSFAEIEKTIADFGARAKDNKLKIEELTGGTFTISNGGVYGSLMSTPIVNPPQSGILGMHAIQQRPVVRDGQLAIGSMMYVALTYDHRIVDGREAVTFLIRIKECIEQPARMLLEV
jgi:2-oxoglutarate dehydrogenase E2 component (dihydrolipoamide succinyltransferase)